MSSPIRFRSALPSDAQVLSQIAFEAKASWGYPAKWMNAWRADLTVTPTLIQSGVGEVALFGTKPIGFHLLLRREKKLRLEHLWVLPEYQRKGIGRSLLQRALLAASGLGCDGLHLESDPLAESFYLRLGAKRIGTIRGTILGTAREIPQLFLSARCV